MSDDSEARRRKRVLYQSRHRGTKEADFIFGGFADAHLSDLTPDQFSRFESLLEESDPDLMNWISDRSAPPPVHDHDVLDLIRQFKISLLRN